MRFRGQGTIEYLIILAIIIVIALIVVGLSGNFFGQATTISEGSSKTYWMSQTPFSITDYSQSSDNLTLVIKNVTADELTLATVVVDGATCDNMDVNISAGDINTMVLGGAADDCTAATISSCTSGSKFTYDIDFTYNTDNIAGHRQSGQKDLVGTCA